MKNLDELNRRREMIFDNIFRFSLKLMFITIALRQSSLIIKAKTEQWTVFQKPLKTVLFDTAELKWSIKFT